MAMAFCIDAGKMLAKPAAPVSRAAFFIKSLLVSDIWWFVGPWLMVNRPWLVF
jgi:hypothetical protein